MWEKFKFYTRVTIFGALALYLLLVMYFNWTVVVQGELNLIFIKFQSPRILLVLLVTAFVSVVAWWLVRAVFKTIRQFRAMRERSRTTKLEKEVADMKAKAGMLQTRETIAPATPSSTSTPSQTP